MNMKKILEFAKENGKNIIVGVGILGLGAIGGGYTVHKLEFGSLGKYPIAFGVNNEKHANVYRELFNEKTHTAGVVSCTHISTKNPEEIHEVVSRAFDDLSHNKGDYLNVLIEKVYDD